MYRSMDMHIYIYAAALSAPEGRAYTPPQHRRILHKIPGIAPRYKTGPRLDSYR